TYCHPLDCVIAVLVYKFLDTVTHRLILFGVTPAVLTPSIVGHHQVILAPLRVVKRNTVFHIPLQPGMFATLRLTSLTVVSYSRSPQCVALFTTFLFHVVIHLW
ncbi:hypothetical protein A2U01_0018214, partial [Trifolium medium]|nr:hypothetical protein [Trifolium medium]